MYRVSSPLANTLLYRQTRTLKLIHTHTVYWCMMCAPRQNYTVADSAENSWGPRNNVRHVWTRCDKTERQHYLYDLLYTSSSCLSLASVRCYGTIPSQSSAVIIQYHTNVLRVRRISNKARSLSRLRCFASSPNPPCDTPFLASVNCLKIVMRKYAHPNTCYM